MQCVPFDAYDFFGYLACGLLTVVGMELVLGFPPVLDLEPTLVSSSLLLLGVYIAGQMAATPAKALLEDGFVGRILGKPSTTLFRRKASLLGRLLLPGYYKPLPHLIADRIRGRAELEGIQETGETLFLHVRYSPDILANEKLILKLDAFINKYGFCRNVSFTTLVFGIALVTEALHVGDQALFEYGVTALVASVLLFYRYLKFYRQYAFEMFNVYGAKEGSR
jgi:hypothetical protein